LNKLEIYNLVCSSHSEPFLVLDVDLRIITMNEQVKKVFNLNQDTRSLTDIFEDDTSKIIMGEVSNLISSNDASKSIELILKLRNGELINSLLDFQKSNVNDSNDVFCKVNSGKNVSGKFEFSGVEIQPADMADLNISEELIYLLNQTISNYPFTFVIKESIHRLADKLENFFWIKDERGVLVIVNDSFARAFGLKSFQMEGKQFFNFIPTFLNKFFESVEQFLQDSHSAIIINGFPLKSFPTINEQELILIPLTDNNNHLVAMAGFTRKKELPVNVKTPEKTSKYNSLIFNNLPNAVAFINDSGYFIETNKEFCKLFARKFNDLTGLKYSEVFSLPLSDTIIRFIGSNSDGIIIDVDDHLEIVRESSEFKLSADKIFDENKKLIGILLNLVKTEFIDDLQQLIKSKGRMFEVLIKKNPEPIFVYDKENLKFLEVNDSALKLYGYSRDEFIQMDLTDLYSPEDIQTLLDTSTGETDEGVFGEPLRHRKKDGTSVVVRLSKIEFIFNDKESVFNVIRDVSDDLDLKQKTHHLQLAFENASDLIFVTDPSGIISSINESAIEKLNLSKDEIENSSLATYGYDEDRVTINNAIFLSDLKEKTNLKVQLKDSGGSPFETNLFIYPQLDVNQEVESYTVIAKVIETPLQSTQPEVKEVSKKVVVEKEVESTPKQSGLEPNFLHGVFHEILTPMNVILGFTQELTESVESLSPEQKEAVDIINQNRVTLLGTMNSIIEFTEISLKNSEIELSEITITSLIEQLDNSMREITGRKDLEFAFGKISSSLKFKTDRKKLDALLHNVIKIVSRVTDTKKIYFSAQPVGEKDFLISISDKYGSVSEKLLNIFDQIFMNSADPKEFGVSKLTTQISKSLLTSINGEYVSYTDNHGRKENGFKFPLDLEDRSALVQELLEEIDEEEVIEDVPEVIVPENLQEELTIEEQTHPVNEEPEQIISDEIVMPDTSDVVDESINDELIIEEHLVEDKTEDDISLIQADTFEEPVSEELNLDESQNDFETEEKFEHIQEEFQKSISEEEFYKPESIEEELTVDEDDTSGFEKADKLDLSGLICLYIEDQVDSQILFKVQMKGLKEIRFCASFEEALPVLETQRFDFIVMDINLQGEYNGLDALKIIHRMPGFDHVPIIAVTAYVLPGDKEKFIATGFNDFISKPIFREKMVESLEKIFVHK
jgi:PAS domain S-box-containing protein